MGAKLSAICSAALVASSDALGPDGKCRIISFRGGGIHGSYEIGALRAIVDHMPPEEVMYDYASGISIGAVIASTIALTAPGQEREAVRMLEELLRGKSSRDMMETRSNLFLSAFQSSSLLTNQKMADMLAGVFGEKPFQRKLSFMAFDMETSQAVTFDETVTNEERVEAVLASTSIPFVFPLQELGGRYYGDGGMYTDFDIGDPVERCREEV